MEFIVTGEEGKILDPPPRPDNSTRVDLYNIKVVDVRLTFRSKNPFFRKVVTRLVKGIGNRTSEFVDRFLRDSVLVSIHTRNIGGDI